MDYTAMTLTKAQVETLREQLEEEKRQIIQHVHEVLGQGSSFHGDSADRSVSLENIENNLELEEVERQQLLDIEKALQKIDEDTYGCCEMCGGQIAYERLEALPAAIYCTDCKSKLEKEQQQR